MMTKKKTLLTKFWAWIKKNWYYFLIIPLVVTGFKALYILFSKGTDLTGMPDLSDNERDKEDKTQQAEKDGKEEKKKIEDEYEEKKNKVRSGETKPSEIINHDD